MNLVSGVSFGLVAGGALLGYMIGSSAVNFQQVSEINRLNSELKNQQEETQKSNQIIEQHKQFIRTKDTVARRFCDQYFKGEKK